MQIVDVEKIEPHGGSIRVFACEASPKLSTSKRVLELLEEEENLNLTKLEDFKIMLQVIV